MRAGQAWLNRWAGWRLAVVNGGLLLWLLPTPSWVRVTVSSLVLVALAAFVPLLVGGAQASTRARRAVLAGEPPETPRRGPSPAANGSPQRPRSRWR